MSDLDTHVTSATVTFNPQLEEVTVTRKKTQTAMVVDTEYESGFTWSNTGLETYRAMAHHVATLASRYGQDSKWATEAALSFARVTTSLHQWGNLTITKDGPLSLFARTPGTNPFVFGIIFHGIHNSCTVEGCPMYVNGETGSTYHYRRYDEIKVQLHKHQWTYPVGAPVPGTWSFHS